MTSIPSLLNLKTTKTTQDLNSTVNVQPVTNINITQRSLSQNDLLKDDVPKSIDESEFVVNEEKQNKDVTISKLKSSPVVQREVSKDDIIKALKLLITILHENPLYYNGFVVADDEKLKEVIKLFTNADEVNIELGEKTCSLFSKKFQRVKNIYITIDENIYNFKYDYTELNKVFRDLRICTKVIF